MADSAASDFTDELSARRFLERIRWPDGPVCPHCAHQGGWPIRGARPGLYKCSSYRCQRQFSVTVGTVLERSKIPISKWLRAVCVLCFDTKAVSSHELHRTLGVTYKSAWLLRRRIRAALKSSDADAVMLRAVADGLSFGGAALTGSPIAAD
jgi:transposase-like protein